MTASTATVFVRIPFIGFIQAVIFPVRRYFMAALGTIYRHASRCPKGFRVWRKLRPIECEHDHSGTKAKDHRK
jgi:hypothetical protein